MDNNCINPIIRYTPIKYASQYYQLKVGLGAMGTVLAKIAGMETSQDWWCKEPIKFVEHLYTKCRRWKKERRKLVRELEKEGIDGKLKLRRDGLLDF